MPNDGIYAGMPGAELSLEEVSARGAERYAKLRANLKADNPNRYVAIDVVSGDYAVGRSTAEARRAVHAKRPGAQLFLRKIGSEPEPDLAARAFAGSLPDSPTAARKL